MPGQGAESRAGVRGETYREAWASAVAKALSHPLRVAILLALDHAGAASPSAIAASISKNLPKLAYHVRELSTAGLVRRTRTRQVRGAVEHIYELTDDGRAALHAVNVVLGLDPNGRKLPSGSRRRRGTR